MKIEMDTKWLNRRLSKHDVYFARSFASLMRKLRYAYELIRKLAQVSNLVTFDFEISFSALPSYTCKDTSSRDKRLFYCCLCISKS